MKTTAERKAAESERKVISGLKRRSFWFNDESLKIIEDFKQNCNCKTNDEAINKLIQAFK